MTRRIHVVGSSPRTGTTLLAELMLIGFEIDAFASHERSIFSPAPARLETYLSKNPQDVNAVSRLLPHDENLFVLHMVRDPRDVVVSRHRRSPDAYWTNLGLWHRYRKAARRADACPRFRTIRYEDLVTDPDAVQDEIASFLPFLKRRRSFSSFERNASPPPRSVEALGGVRAVDASSVGVWRAHKPRLAAQIARHGPIDRDLRELGYESDDGWKRELDGVVPDNGTSHLGEDVTWRLRVRWALRRERRLARYRRRLRKGEPARKPARERTPRAQPGPFDVQRIRAGQVRLEIGTLGEGPAVLMLPGLGMPGTEEFGELGEALAAAGFRAIALNPRGIGRSRGRLLDLTLHDLAADAENVLRHFDTSAHVVGRAYGNRVARCLAADAPERVRSLTLIAAGGLVPSTSKTKEASVWRRRRRRWPKVRRSQKAANDATPLGDWWDGGAAPMLVVQGLADSTAPPENGRRLASDHPERVRLIEIEGAGHGLLEERGDRVVPAILEFLEQMESATANPGRGAPEGE